MIFFNILFAIFPFQYKIKVCLQKAFLPWRSSMHKCSAHIHMQIIVLSLLIAILFCFCTADMDERTPLITPKSESSAEKTDSLSQNGITFYFDTHIEYGKFANGDYWVKGPVKITNITPEFDGKHNGWEVNPMPTGPLGFDERISDFDPSIVPDLPYIAEPGQSIVKAISREPYSETASMKTRLQKAAVLTILEQAPTNSEKLFRPPYVGRNKVFYSIESIRTELLPSLQYVSGAPTLDEIESKFKPVQMNHRAGLATAYMPPLEHLGNYASSNATRFNYSVLRLMLDDPIEEKMGALIALLQCGIDYYHFTLEGQMWPRGGGEQPGNKLPIVFFATMMGDNNIKQHVKELKLYEDYLTFYGKDSVVLWGDFGWEYGHSIEQYWRSIALDNTTRTIADPHGYIDGGKTPGGGYQYCCTSKPFKGTVLCLLLMPEMLDIWHPKALIDYVDRWVEFGTWTQPDPCAPPDTNWENYGVTFGEDPNNPGDCIRDTDSSDGIGRFPDRHGVNADKGSYGSPFIDSMWDVYR